MHTQKLLLSASDYLLPKKKAVGKKIQTAPGTSRNAHFFHRTSFFPLWPSAGEQGAMGAAPRKSHRKIIHSRRSVRPPAGLPSGRRGVRGAAAPSKKILHSLGGPSTSFTHTGASSRTVPRGPRSGNQTGDRVTRPETAWNCVESTHAPEVVEHTRSLCRRNDDVRPPGPASQRRAARGAARRRVGRGVFLARQGGCALFFGYDPRLCFARLLEVGVQDLSARQGVPMWWSHFLYTLSTVAMYAELDVWGEMSMRVGRKEANHDWEWSWKAANEWEGNIS